jgi:hypothetical protein
VYDNFVRSGICGKNLSYWTTDNCHWNDKAHEMVGKNLAYFVMDTFHYLPASIADTEKNLNSITATFNQGSTIIYDTATLDSLKQYLAVTASYNDGSTETVTGYTLSGTLVEGTSTVTVSYGGKTVTFTVEVTKNSGVGGGDEPPENDWSIAIISNTVGTANYADDTLEIAGVNKTFGGVIFDGATEVSLSVDENYNKSNTNIGWFIIRDGDTFHAFGGKIGGTIEAYDFDETLGSPSVVNVGNVSFPSTGNIIIRIETTMAKIYANDALLFSVAGDAIGYAASTIKALTLYGLKIS